ncbi:hypothetical protein [Candidatus Enterococcus ferrettii]|uniref:Uncharacterized protein n=1 Tax=Candidatus Enterococcus ferrettii TaxID=2815324 RepID=A0ABV0EMZ4_9ENTE|nr:hypothetical protein [Enterococcus sp. 665A]MBO1339783.1 hypothetical protein [Enterococcus sp. 665A]
MKRIYRYLTVAFGIITLIISHSMVGTIAYQYRELVCQNEHGLTSSPPAMIYILVLPFTGMIVVSIIVMLFFRLKSKGRTIL